MSNTNVACAGLIGPVLFFSALAGFAAIRPEYSHLHKAVSELGVITAPNALAWNVIGFIIPGLLLAVSGATAAQAIDGGRKTLWYLLVLAGVCFALTGVFPAQMQDGHPVMQSPLTILHLVAVLSSSVFWISGALLLPWRTKHCASWNSFTRKAVLLAVLCCGGSVLNMTLLPILLPQLQYMPGIIQRIGFALCLVWYFVLALHLLHRGIETRPGKREKQGKSGRKLEVQPEQVKPAPAYW